MLHIRAYYLICYEIESIIALSTNKAEIKMKHTYTMAYPFGDSTLERLVRLYENFGIASVCCGDDKGFFVEPDHVIKYNIKKEA